VLNFLKIELQICVGIHRVAGNFRKVLSGYCIQSTLSKIRNLPQSPKEQIISAAKDKKVPSEIMAANTKQDHIREPRKLFSGGEYDDQIQ
jgi:hypothetical protein